MGYTNAKTQIAYSNQFTGSVNKGTIDVVAVGYDENIRSGYVIVADPDLPMQLASPITATASMTMQQSSGGNTYTATGTLSLQVPQGDVVVRADLQALTLNILAGVGPYVQNDNSFRFVGTTGYIGDPTANAVSGQLDGPTGNFTMTLTKDVVKEYHLENGFEVTVTIYTVQEQE